MSIHGVHELLFPGRPVRSDYCRHIVPRWKLWLLRLMGQGRYVQAVISRELTINEANYRADVQEYDRRLKTVEDEIFD